MADEEHRGEVPQWLPEEERPADAGQHASAGDDPEDAGEDAAEADTPVPPDPGEAADEALAAGGDRLHLAMVKAIKMGLVISSTTGPGHGTNSYHYRTPYRHVVIRGRRYELGRAADIAKVGNPDALYRKYFRAIEPMRPTEMFYDPMGFSWKNGQKVPWIVGDHEDHVHVAF